MWPGFLLIICQSYIRPDLHYDGAVHDKLFQNFQLDLQYMCYNAILTYTDSLG